MFRILSKLALLSLLLLPGTAEAQRVCFSFASETNDDGPNFYAQVPNLITDGSFWNGDGLVQAELLIQPFCDAGPVIGRKVYVKFFGRHYDFQQNFFAGAFAQDWAMRGGIVFVDLDTGDALLEIYYEEALLTSWSPDNPVIGHTLTLQDSEAVDRHLKFVSSPDLDALLAAEGFPPALLDRGEQFTFTLSNVRRPGGVSPFFPNINAVGDWFDEWVADGSFSAAAGI